MNPTNTHPDSRLYLHRTHLTFLHIYKHASTDHVCSVSPAPEAVASQRKRPGRRQEQRKKFIFRLYLQFFLKKSFYLLVQTSYDVTWECPLPRRRRESAGTLEPANSIFENHTGLIDQYSCSTFNHCCVCACVCVGHDCSCAIPKRARALLLSSTLFLFCLYLQPL